MADFTPQRAGIGGMGWIIGGLVLVLLLLFIVFGYGARTPATDTTAPAADPAPATDEAAPATIQ